MNAKCIMEKLNLSDAHLVNGVKKVAANAYQHQRDICLQVQPKNQCPVQMDTLLLQKTQRKLKIRLHQ